LAECLSCSYCDECPDEGYCCGGYEGLGRGLQVQICVRVEQVEKDEESGCGRYGEYASAFEWWYCAKCDVDSVGVGNGPRDLALGPSSAEEGSKCFQRHLPRADV